MAANHAMRRMRAVVEDAAEDAEFTARLIDAIDNDPDVRAAILRLARRANPPTAKTTTAARGRSR